MYINKRKAKPLTRIKHSKFIDEDPNIDDICTRIQSTCMKTSTVDNLNYERENTTTPKKDTAKCTTNKSNNSSLISNSLSTHKHSINFIDKISVDVNITKVNRILKRSTNAVCINKHKTSNNMFNSSNQSILNHSQSGIINAKNESKNKIIPKKEKECCTIKLFIYTFMSLVIIVLLLLVVGLTVHFVSK